MTALRVKSETLHDVFLRNDLSYFAEHILKMEISSHHKIWSELVAKHDKVSILCPRDHGKCLISSEKAVLANGDRVAIKDLKPGDQVFSVGPDYKARVNAVEVMQLCGLKKCVEIKTRTGREIKAALTHPFLKYSGWTKAEDLKVGDRLAAPRNIPIDLPGCDVSFSEIALLGHVIANGGVTRRFTVSSRKYQALLVRLFNACYLDASWDEREGCFSVRGGMDFLERYNLFGKKSVDKNLPVQVFRFSKKQLAVFIGHLWSDGDVTFVERNYRGCKGQVNIDLCMANEQLVKDVQHLLLRLGILSTFAEKTIKYKKQDGSTARAWRVSVTGKENQLKWFCLVGCHLFRDDMERCVRFLEGLDSNSQNDQIPNGWKVHLKNTDRWHREHSGIRIDSKYEIGRDKLSRVAEAEDNDKLRELASSDVLWDEIVSIKDIGMHECADIQVERDHNYICNDFFTHNSYFFSFAYIIWRAYYGWIPPLPSGDFKSIPRRSLGYIFSNTQENSIAFLGMVRDEILMNPMLQHLIPARKDQWSKTGLKLANNTIIRARGYGVAVRGGHPCFVVADDVLTDENIYSEIQREKVKDYFYSAVTPMVIPGGQTIVVGTPMHASDLYADLKNNAEYRHCHFSAIDEHGKALWPTRYSLNMLKAREREIGSVRFAREYRCIPVSDASSLFPEKILTDCYRQDLELLTDVPDDLWDHYDVYTGIDLALSASVGADFSVITTLGVDKYKNRRLLDIRRSKGKSMTDQLREIEEVNYKFRPQKIYIEDNQFQRVFRDQLVANTDMPVHGFTTTAQKNSLERGVPSLQILFENRKFQIPRRTERDRRITDVLLGELKCFTWTNGKLAGVGSHDDTVMSLWIANEACSSSGFSFSFD